jgi:hypothetical protein
MVKAGPLRAEEVCLKQALKWINEVASYDDHRISTLALTGGEPFVDLEPLKVIADHALHCGLRVSITSNAFWATTRRQAIHVLSLLPAVKSLQISTDLYHLRFIPLSRVRNAVFAANALGIACRLAICTDGLDPPAESALLRHIAGFYPTKHIRTLRPFRAGRAAHGLDVNSWPTSPTPPQTACRAACCPIIFPDGRVLGCVGPLICLKGSHPLVLGNLCVESMANIFDRAQTNPILHALRVWGPSRLLQHAQRFGLGDYLPRRYVAGSTCDACYGLFAHSKVCAFLHDLSTTQSFQRKVAYARLYYLGEVDMVERMGG